ncbi:MAG TPA: tyrosine-type recombinase/integrase [Methanotrichaceae archaeon]|nr:tyrosine-type recombinase/integrase [Methanotrichaceae archaeon]
MIENLTEPEMRKMLESACGLDRIMLLLLFETGLKVEELIDLRVSDVDLEGGYVRTPGGEKLQISSQTLAEMKRYLKARPSQIFLFEGRCGKPITVKWKRCVLEKLLLMKSKDQGFKGQD